MLQPPCFLFCFLFISIIFMIPTPFNMVFTLSDTLITDIGRFLYLRYLFHFIPLCPYHIERLHPTK